MVCQIVEESTLSIREHFYQYDLNQLRFAVICGSGMSKIGDILDRSTSIPFSMIENFPSTTIHGQGSNVVVGYVNGNLCLFMTGRFHFYEGHSSTDLVFPIRVLSNLGINSLIMTNSAGSLNENFEIGDIMVIEDHISFPILSGENPLRCLLENPMTSSTSTSTTATSTTNINPFVPLNNVYCKNSFLYVKEAFIDLGLDQKSLHRGVYVGVGGPTYETPAEVRFLRGIGGDVVGMSTTMEVVVAAHLNIKVLGISLISNKCIREINFSKDIPSHSDVIYAAEKKIDELSKIIKKILEKGDKF